MIYTWGSAIAIVVAVLVDVLLTRCRLVHTGTFWIAYAIILVFQLIMNGLLTGLPIVTYDPDVHLGVRVANAPIEDIGFGFAMVLLCLTTWQWVGRREPDTTERRPGRPDRDGARG